MKKKTLKILKGCAAALISLALLAVIAFYTLIVLGLSPKLQTIWVCSAMKTMSHQYLATAFIPMETIERIMEENHVDDSGYDSDILTFEKQEETTDVGKENEIETDANSETDETETDANPETDETETDANPETDETETDANPETDEIETDANPETDEIETDTSPETDETETDTSPETEPIPAFEERESSDEDPYLAQGYELLEDGLYLKPVSGLTWRGYVMLVEDPLRVKLVDTSQQYSCGENVMTMVKNSGAVAGINGGGFQDGVNYDSNGGTPAGLLIEDRNLVYPYVADDVTVYNMIGINSNGALVLRHCTAQWALDNGIVSAVSFSPFLVVNGEGLIKNGTGGWGIAPRTAIGQRKTGEFLLLVIDGRQLDWSIGCDLDVLQQVMLEEGAYNAAMLDGGSSTAMVYNGGYINKPSLGHERWINNCFVVTPAAEE